MRALEGVDCRNCTERHENCHAECEEYMAAFNANRELEQKKLPSDFFVSANTRKKLDRYAAIKKKNNWKA